MGTKIVKVGDVKCGADKLFLIAGPCVIESEKLVLSVAEKVKEIGDRLGLKTIFKSSFQKDNRSSLDYYQGPGLDNGLKILAKVKEKFGMPILTDVHYPNQVSAVAEIVDVIQIPAFLCMQSGLLVAAAKSGKAINIKHGQFLAPENMKYPLQKCLAAGNDRVLLTERGYTFGYGDLIVDPRSFYHLRALGYPVIFDIPHSVRRYGIPSSNPTGGAREFLPVLSRAGVAAGVDGLFIETHPRPEKALCDGSSQLPLNKLSEFLKPLIELHDIEVSVR